MAAIWAVVPAAGRGTRMGAPLPKQYLRLGDSSVLECSVARLREAGVYQVVVPVAPDDRAWRELPFPGGTPPQFIDGGALRAESVLRGVEYVCAQGAAEGWVMVHDAVRPCVRPEEIRRLVTVVGESAVGGLLAIPVIDTLKRAHPGAGQATVARTEERALYWRAQTPQLFRAGLLREALQQALAAGDEITDEAAAIERLGHSPILVAGRSDNLKITTAADLELAGYIIARQQEERELARDATRETG